MSFNLDCLTNDSWVAETIEPHGRFYHKDVILFKCRRCGIKFSVVRGVLYGALYDAARDKRLRVRCPSYLCQAWEYGGRNV